MTRRKVTGEQSERRGNPFMFAGGVVGAGIVVMGLAILIGKSDSGQINVAATIQESNQAQSESGGEQVSSVPQAFQNMPNGGLVPQENQVNTPPAPEPSEATVIDDTASTTQTEGDDVVGQETETSETESTDL